MAKSCNPSICHELLLELVTYNKRTGIFKSKVNGHLIKKGDVLGSLNSRGYVRWRLLGRHVYMHRLAWFYVHGRWPADLLDHRNGVFSDNRIANLRECDTVRNGRNRKLGSNNRSGKVGVFYVKRENRWRADIKLPDRRLVLGEFKTYEEASAARSAAEVVYFAEFRRGA